jgi:hypothetical protein
MIGNNVSPIACTRMCGKVLAVLGMSAETFASVKPPVTVGASAWVVSAMGLGKRKKVLTSRGPVGKGSAVRFACFLSIFRAASALACWNCE